LAEDIILTVELWCEGLKCVLLFYDKGQ